MAWTRSEEVLSAIKIAGERNNLPQKVLDAFLDLRNRGYTDNFRAAKKNDTTMMAAYDTIAEEGCCGYIDMEVEVGEEIWMVGCNYDR